MAVPNVPPCQRAKTAVSWQRVWRYCCRRRAPIPERTAPIARAAGSYYSLSSRQRADFARADVCWRLKPTLQVITKTFESTPSQTKLQWAAFEGDRCFSLTPTMGGSDSPAPDARSLIAIATTSASPATGRALQHRYADQAHGLRWKRGQGQTRDRLARQRFAAFIA